MAAREIVTTAKNGTVYRVGRNHDGVVIVRTISPAWSGAVLEAILDNGYTVEGEEEEGARAAAIGTGYARANGGVELTASQADALIERLRKAEGEQ
jgi:hypothetical protein